MSLCTTPLLPLVPTPVRIIHAKSGAFLSLCLSNDAITSGRWPQPGPTCCRHFSRARPFQRCLPESSFCTKPPSASVFNLLFDLDLSAALPGLFSHGLCWSALFNVISGLNPILLCLYQYWTWPIVPSRTPVLQYPQSSNQNWNYPRHSGPSPYPPWPQPYLWRPYNRPRHPCNITLPCRDRRHVCVPWPWGTWRRPYMSPPHPGTYPDHFPDWESTYWYLWQPWHWHCTLLPSPLLLFHLHHISILRAIGLFPGVIPLPLIHPQPLPKIPLSPTQVIEPPLQIHSHQFLLPLNSLGVPLYIQFCLNILPLGSISPSSSIY